MFLRRDKTKLQPIDKYLDRYYTKYKPALDTLIAKLYYDEDMWGKTNIQYKINQYIYAFQLVTLVYLEYSKGLNKDWSSYITKYSLETFDKKFQCSGVYLRDILSIFELPTIPTSVEYGVSKERIEETLIVGAEVPTVTPTSPVEIEIQLPIVTDEVYVNVFCNN